MKKGSGGATASEPRRTVMASHSQTKSHWASRQIFTARTERFYPPRVCTRVLPLTLTKSCFRRIKICRVIIEIEVCRGWERSHSRTESALCDNKVCMFRQLVSILVKTKSKQPFHRGTPATFLQRIFCWKPKVFKGLNSCAASCRQKLDQNSTERQNSLSWKLPSSCKLPVKDAFSPA